jgi:RHS repeat-associated protein
MTQDERKVSVPQIRYPKGGGAIKGIGETFQPSPFTGDASFTIPIELPPARGLEPDLTLSYSSGGAQGPFGMGFALSVPTISRRTEKRLPNYSEDDEFVLSGAEYLVPALLQNGQVWHLDERTNVTDPHERDALGALLRPADRTPFHVRRYRTRSEGPFLRVERWTRQHDGDVHWRVTTPNAITSIYGRSPAARISNPADPQQVFSWLIESSADPLGNRIQYHYKAEDGAGLSADSQAAGRDQAAQRYVQRVEYGNYREGQSERFAFSVLFDYGDYELDPTQLTRLSLQPTRDWPVRQDPFSDYRAGFEVRTQRLCRNILLFHHFEHELGIADCLVRRMQLSYDERPTVSFLREVVQTGYRFTGRGYTQQSLPPLSFGYSGFDPSTATPQPLEAGLQQQGAMSFEAEQYRLLDLYGEGIPGILFDSGGVTLFWRAEGQGRYAAAHAPAAFPIERNGLEPTYDLSDGARTRLTVRDLGRAGTYTLSGEQGWESLRPYAGTPLEFYGDTGEYTDVTGDGRPDLLLFEDDRVRVYPTTGDAGYGTAFSAPRGLGLPPPQTASAEEVLLFEDMAGDGLSDRVRVRSGEVLYWPNLGYGRFGSPVRMRNAPVFPEGLEASRLLTADIDGSGTTDLIYVGLQHVDIYFNQSGNSFSAPARIPLPAPYHQLAQIQFADIQGNGTACLVFSAGVEQMRHQFIDFSGGTKPHLLVEVDNHLGALTRLRYAPSTRFYLDDQRAGRPWLSRLPFPVNVVEQVETLDEIARSRQVSRYAYRHGAYDYVEREFAGFGLVERWDSESFAEYRDLDGDGVGDEQYTRPVHSRTWYHTGLIGREGGSARLYEREYFGGGSLPFNLPDTHFELPQGAGLSRFEPHPADPDSLHAAYRALRGQVLREESFAAERAGPEVAPFGAEETAYSLRLVQPRDGQRPSVYLALPREKIAAIYEQEAQHPRLLHSFYLRHDEFGRLTHSVELAYGRGERAQHAEQSRTQGRYNCWQWINQTGPIYRLGTPARSQCFELSRLPGQQASWEQIAALAFGLEAAGRAAEYHEPLESKGARLLEWSDYHYWNDTRQALLPLGEAGTRALLHRVDKAVHSETGFAADLRTDAPGQDFIAAVAESGAGELVEMMLDPGYGGFVFSQRLPGGERYYMNIEITAYYLDELDYYQPRLFIDQFETNIWVEYDRYRLQVVQSNFRVVPADPENGVQEQVLVHEADPDYVTMQPLRTRDLNRTTTEYRYDPLGRVMLVSRYGPAGEQMQGDAELPSYAELPSPESLTLVSILADPLGALRGGTNFFWYHPQAWQAQEDQRQPAFSLSIRREHYSRGADGETQPNTLLVELEYSDGLGRSVQQKRLVEGGPALRVVNGQVGSHTVAERWLNSGRTVYNNKGLVVKQFEPFFSDSPRYHAEPTLTEHGATTVAFYDELGRVIREEMPNGTLTRTHYQSWASLEYDANDTLAESRAYARRDDGSLTGDDRAALLAALPHADTPGEQWLDVWGRPFLSLERDGTQTFYSYTQLDLAGNALRVQDARLFGTSEASFTASYDMQGRANRRFSQDAGLRLTIFNASSDVIHAYDGRGVLTSNFYDPFGRTIEVWMLRDGRRWMSRQTVYGEGAERDVELNLRGKPILHRDGAGEVTYQRYSIDGDWLECQRRPWTRDDVEPDWFPGSHDAPAPRLDNKPYEAYLADEPLREAQRFDTLGRVLRLDYPNKARAEYRYARGGKLQSVALREAGTPARTTTFVERIRYNARGQREEIVYGNDTRTRYHYDPATFLLRRQETLRGQQRLQDIAYAYDPVGNLTHVRDRSHETVFHNNQRVAAEQTFRYDALYRLVAATGREHSGRNAERRSRAWQWRQSFAQTIQGAANGAALQNYLQSFSYDAAGNLERIQHVAAQNRFEVTIGLSARSNRWNDAAASAPSSQDYDGNGNRARLAHLRRLEWNDQNRLARVETLPHADGSSDGERYFYGSTGQRARRVSLRRTARSEHREETLYFGSYEIRRAWKGGSLDEELFCLHLLDGDERLAIACRWERAPLNQLLRAQDRYQLGTLHGSVALELDSAGKLLTYEEYYPYGGTALVAADKAAEVERKRYRYAGHELDDVSGLYYFGQRYYAPWLGRWLSPDPAGMVDGPNLYSYVRGNPLRFSDQAGTVIGQLPRNNVDPANIVNRGPAPPQQPLVPAGNTRRLVAFWEHLARSPARDGQAARPGAQHQPGAQPAMLPAANPNGALALPANQAANQPGGRARAHSAPLPRPRSTSQNPATSAPQSPANNAVQPQANQTGGNPANNASQNPSTNAPPNPGTSAPQNQSNSAPAPQAPPVASGGAASGPSSFKVNIKDWKKAAALAIALTIAVLAVEQARSDLQASGAQAPAAGSAEETRLVTDALKKLETNGTLQNLTLDFDQKLSNPPSAPGAPASGASTQSGANQANTPQGNQAQVANQPALAQIQNQQRQP